MIRTWLLTDTGRFPRKDERAFARSLSEQMPRIVLEARRVASTVGGGFHGRRQAGMGEDFWQFRPFSNGEPATRIDWRRSARDNKLYVREREWQASHTFWLWCDQSRSMQFSSNLAQTSKIERAIVLGLALAHILVTNGERVGLLGGAPARSSRSIIDFLAEQMLINPESQKVDLPPPIAIPARSEALLIGDFFSPLPELENMLTHATSHSSRGHVVMICDPVEETFPFKGQTLLQDPETQASLKIGDAANWAEVYRARLQLHRQTFHAMLKAKGWTMTIHHTDRPASETALQILSLLSAAHRPSAQEV